MKHIMAISIILCGLLSSTIEASEKKTLSAIANTSQSHGNSPQHSLPIPIVKTPVSKTIPLKKRNNNSYSSSYSPRYPQASPQQNSFSNSTSPSSTSIDPYSISINKFFVGSHGQYHLINKDGSLNEDMYITDEDKRGYINHYEAQLNIKKHPYSVTTTRLIHPGCQPIEFKSSIQATLSNTQIQKLLQLPQEKKIIASDDVKNLYYILSCTSNSADSSEQS